jgi:dihydropteroate synthase
MSLRGLRICPCFTDEEARALLFSIGVDPYGVEAMTPKMRHLNVFVKQVACRDGNIIKQEMLSLGGDAAVSRGTVGCTDRETDVLIMGTKKQVLRLAEKLEHQPGRIRELAVALKELISRLEPRDLKWKTSRREMVLGSKTLLMGILNCTPDSFSDGGRYVNREAAVTRGLAMVEEGADIIDVGGESSRPGADPVAEDEELRRVIPVIEELAKKCDVPISIDTMKASVARRALEVGAEIVNDISALTFDAGMREVVARFGAGVILMHMRGLPKTMQVGEITYNDVVGDIISYLEQRMEVAKEGGIPLDRIVCDPGIGFGKTAEQNYAILRRLSEFGSLGRPILIGVSRKSLIGAVTGEGPEGRLEGTAAAVTAAILGGAKVVRVHDVKEMRKVISVADAVRYGMGA